MVVIEFDRSRSISLSALDDNDVTLSNALDNQGQNLLGKACAKAVLICRPNSHPFQERELRLDNPVKIGRSVARARPTTSNAIFDCKVLSRNHALIWYQDGKFYLQDTKSSNGTFVNNQRLSKGSEDSAPREVCSGDIVQFGVDVMENARKVTHGCIIATLKLYLPDGKEAKASMSTAVNGNGSCETLGQHDLYQLNQFIQEAFLREQVLETKLGTLQRIVQSTRDAARSSWNALIEEDRLLTRIETLENQLMTYSKNFSEDKLREEVRKLHEEKNVYQSVAKESLRKVLVEKMEALKKLHEVERCLNSAEEERDTVKELNDKLSQQVSELVEQLKKESEEINDWRVKLTEAEEAQQRLVDDVRNAEEKLEEAKSKETQLLAQIESCQAEVDFTKQQLANLRARMEAAKQKEVEDNDEKEETETIDKTIHEMETLKEKVILLEKELEKSTKMEKLNRESYDYEGGANDELQQLKELLEDSRTKCRNLEAEVSRSQLEAQDGWTAASELQQQLRALHSSLTARVHTTAEDDDDPLKLADSIGRCLEDLQRQLAAAEESNTKNSQLTAALARRAELAESQLLEAQTIADALQGRVRTAEEAAQEKDLVVEELAARIRMMETASREVTDDRATSSEMEVLHNNQMGRSFTELSEAREELEQMKLQVDAADEAKRELQKQLDELKENYSFLSSQAQTVGRWAYVLPIAVIVLAVLIAFRPAE